MYSKHPLHNVGFPVLVDAHKLARENSLLDSIEMAGSSPPYNIRSGSKNVKCHYDVLHIEGMADTGRSNPSDLFCITIRAVVHDAKKNKL